MTKAIHQARQTRLVVWIVKDQQRVAVWDLDVEKSPNLFAVIRKEFAWCTVAWRPELAGRPYSIDLDLVQSPIPAVQFDVRVEGCERSLPFQVPVQSLGPLGSALAGALEIQPPCRFELTVCSKDDVIKMGFSVEAEEDGFEICDSQPLLLPLRQDFELGSLGTPTQLVRRESPMWLDRCIFEANVFEQFIQGAREATDVERGWLGNARVFLEDGHIAMVIESIDEVIGSVERASIRSNAVEVYQMLTKWPGASLYLHSHPRLGNATSPGLPHLTPSGPDVVVGQTLDSLSRLPVIMPISACALQDETEFAAYAFAHGHLVPVSVEVIV